MLISVPISALAIGSFVALIPIIGFIWVIHQRTRIEDQFLLTYSRDPLNSGFASLICHPRVGLMFATCFGP